MAVLGDIALVGYKSDNPDSFAFVLLADLSGQTITYSDNGALAAGGLRSGEGALTYVVPANTPIGTVITITSVGTMAFNADGDQLIAYVGSSASPTFLFSLDFADGNTTYAADATTATTSAVPTGLTAGTNALAFAADNGAYAGSLTGTKAEILANIANPANWVFSDTTGQTYPGSFTITAGTAATVSINDVSITEGDAGTSVLTFTVTRSDASGAFSVDYATANGTATAGSDFTATSGTLSFTAGGALTQTISVTITGDTVTEGNESFTVSLSNLVNSSGTAAISDASGTGTITNDDITIIAIHDIQGAAHTSPLVGTVVTTRGIVTAVDTNGFYIQTPDADIDASDATSQGIFIFTNSAPTVASGDAVTVTGTVSEFTPGGSGSNNLSSTQLTSPTISVQSSGNALPTAIILGAGGRTPPTEIIDNDNFATFDPGSDGIDFFESLEGMRVTVPSPLVVAPTTPNGELFTVANGGTGATGLSARGTIVTKGSVGDGLNVTNTGAGSDYNPERIQIDGDSFTPGGANSIPLVAAGTVLNDVTGIVSYGFGNYEVLATTAVTVATPSILTGEVTNLLGNADTLTIASYNVLNLDPNDADGDTDVADGRFTSIALQIVNALGSPDIVALQEIQDSSGSANDGTVSASMTLQMLVDAIAANGGPVYSFIDNPFITNNTNGGEPGGNIRVAYLYDASRVTLVAGSVATTPNAATDFAGSRQPLVASFEFNGETVTVINNHFSSKGGSSPLFGAVQPSTNGSAADRLVQAQNVANYVSSLGSSAKVVVLGDLNEFTNEESLAPLGAAGLASMSLTLPETERYSYIFEGNAQELDQIYVSGNLTTTTTLDIVHVNSEFVTTAATGSDHDPSVIAITIAPPGPAPFAPGDIAFVGFNADGNDDIAFVALREIPAGTVIYFNDREWTGAAFNTGEGEVTWTASSSIAAGTVVTINNFGSTPVSNLGTTSSNTGLSTSSEIVYAYVGAPGAPTAFLAAIANNGFTADGGTLTGTGLVAGTTAIDLSVVDAGADIGVFNGARNGQDSYAGFLAQINNPANWLTQDTAADDSIDATAPNLPLSVAGFTLGSAEVQSVGFAGNVSQAEGNAGTTAFVFTVTRTGGTTGALDFSGSFAANTTDAADYVGNSLPTGFSGTIAAGATSATVTINVAGDTSIESSEGFSLTLTSVSNSAGVSASIAAGSASATGTITNDDLAPAAFGPGDVAFVGFNSDGADNLALVALKELPSGTVLYFSDNEWNGTTWTDFNESTFALTLTSTVSAGSLITIDAINTAANTVSNVGTVANVAGGGGSRGLGNSGEQVYVYIANAGTPLAPTAFLAAVSNDGFTGGNGTLSGTGLATGTSAIDLGSVDAGADIGAYTGARGNQTSFANYLASINNAANWVTQDASGDQSADGTAPNVPFSSLAFSLASPAQTIGFASASLTRLVDEGDAGSKQISFTVERSGGTMGQLDFTGSFAPGTTDAADFGGSLPTGFSGSIAAGASSATVTISISGDTSIEASENFTLTLTGGSNPVTTGVLVNGATATASVTIVNDDFPLAIGGIDVHSAAASLAGSATTPVASNDVVLVRLGSITGTVAGAESIAFEGGKVYTTNIAGNAINIHSITAAGALVNEGAISLSGLPSYAAGGVNSVDIKNGIIAVGYENADPAQAGFVALFNAANNSLIKTIQVGILPDDVTFTPDGSKLLVANEGEALSAQGTVSIIDLSAGAANAVVTNTISFASLNGAEAALRNRGMAIAPGQPAAGDIEPEYITISADGTRAYVTLQEVNAIAVIDLTNPMADRPLAIQPLGTIDRNLPGNALDTSDIDGGINLRNVDIVSLPQPDAVASFTVGGVTYLVTANEGDSRVNLTDSVRLSASSYILDPTRFPNAAAMKANADLGRLNVLSNLGDTDGDGDIDVIHTLGGRSISIFRQEADGSLTKVRETGGEFEAIIAANHPGIFNSNQNTASSSRDTRSDDKGPEPEGVSIGVVGGRTYAFVGLERVGGYMVYDVTDPANARFVTYKPQTGADLGPETSTFVAAANSPTGQALLLSAQEISNSVTLYSVQTQSDGDDVINGGSDGERWNGRGGNDVINGIGGDDIIDGGAGNDVINGGIGNDTASFASASGGIRANLGTGRATGPGGEADRLVDIENLLGSAFDDFLQGDQFDNIITGGAGNDVLFGGRGNDVLNGGDGNDVLQGGVGADVFHFDKVSNGTVDYITDLYVGLGDRISFGAGVTVIGASVSFLGTDPVVNGVNLENRNVALDLTLTLSSADGVQTVHIIDAYNFATNAFWEAQLGLDLNYPRPLPSGLESVNLVTP